MAFILEPLDGASMETSSGSSIFDQPIDRKSSDSIKWRMYPEDVLPMWVADMDFLSPEPVIAAVRERAEHGVFGYPEQRRDLLQAIVDWLADRYEWTVRHDQIVLLPGVVTGLNLVTRTVCEPGDGVLMQTPVYPPFLSTPENSGCVRQEAPLVLQHDSTYQIDFDQFEQAIERNTRLFILCNPHNPVGRVFRKEELERLAEICLRHDLFICSDEIHCDLVFRGSRHIPTARLSEEIAQRTITLMAPSKTFNIAGLECSFAVVQNPDLKRALERTMRGVVSFINPFGQVAAKAAYRQGKPWLDELLVYLEENRDELCEFVRTELPGIRMAKPEGTYLAWLDCRELELTGGPYEFFLRKARVALNDGRAFGSGGDGFVRLNFGCARSTLREGLQRMKAALEGR